MTCFTTSHGRDLPDRPTPRSRDPINVEPYRNYGTVGGNSAFQQLDRREMAAHGNYRRQNMPFADEPHGASVRHTHTSTTVDLTEDERNRNFERQMWDVFRQQPSNSRNNLNGSNVPDLASRNSNKRKSQGYDDSSRMVYPTEANDQPAPNDTAHIRSKRCYDGLCDEVEGYPTDKIHRILNHSKELRKFFSTKITEIIVTTPPNVDSRFGADSSMAEPLCKTMVHTRFPKSAVNMNNIEQLLINVDNYQQGIQYETCSTNNGPCMFAQEFPQDYVASCTQKYTVRKLMVVGKESDNPVFDDFKIPSCCVCTVQQVTNNGKT
ncbi:hypothetical protein NQ318_022960 [Aromia moschata]|uniref:Spaetzle domain-containing protein n=1 Tax=Aromia moschata TaxID=1265417 RepID=A0AAV8XGA0_9CUCU|nr:hypothetical protein NQ318_022960 [Aromia moschata]